VKPNINSVEVHPQLSNSRHPVDGAMVGVGWLWPSVILFDTSCHKVFMFISKEFIFLA
jgi:hypothetical protein